MSNSTPPPSTSPLSVKVKSEPMSPPRDMHHPGGQNHSGGGNGGGIPITTINSVGGLSQSGTSITTGTVLSHSQQHLIINSRTGSTGHLTPNSGEFENEFNYFD